MTGGCKLQEILKGKSHESPRLCDACALSGFHFNVYCTYFPYICFLCTTTVALPVELPQSPVCPARVPKRKGAPAFTPPHESGTGKTSTSTRKKQKKKGTMQNPAQVTPLQEDVIFFLGWGGDPPLMSVDIVKLSGLHRNLQGFVVVLER